MGPTIRSAGLLLMAPFIGAGNGHGQADGRLPELDRARLAEVVRLAEAVRRTVWPGWEHTAMPVLFVAESTEFLVGHRAPGTGFTPLGHDSLLRGEIWSRPRRFPATLLATFPAVAGRPTIVVGSAERTGKSPREWVLTLLHEHFHQWQSSRPGYYARVAGLGLARGDTTGQWMLDYPFPYDSAPVQRAVSDLAASLNRALSAPHDAAMDALLESVAARDRLRRLLSPPDYRYLEFQLWQEGVSRFVEIAVAEAAGNGYAALAARMRSDLKRDLREMSLARSRRIAFYSLGAGLALLLERHRRDWKEVYERRPFVLAELLPAGP
jgi:hypothetical protein